MAGDPTIEDTAGFVTSLIDAGTDIIEIGMPFSDPAADGVSVQVAGQRALQNGVTTSDIFALVSNIRSKHNDTPIILMGYYNPIYQMGEEAFVHQATDAGVDGLIVVDLPYEMAHSLATISQSAGLASIPLVAPNSSAERMRTTLAHAQGFIYAIAIKGITGSKTPDITQVEQQVSTIRSVSNLPIMLGFGIRTAPQAKALSQYVDGVVVGSAYCDHIQTHLEDIHAAQKVLYTQARSIKTAITL